MKRDLSSAAFMRKLERNGFRYLGLAFFEDTTGVAPGVQFSARFDRLGKDVRFRETLAELIKARDAHAAKTRGPQCHGR